MRLKEKFEKRPILSKSVWKIVKLHRQYMYGSQQLTRGATFQAVDNGGDRNCHFLGFARISKFFVHTDRMNTSLLFLVANHSRGFYLWLFCTNQYPVCSLIAEWHPRTESTWMSLSNQTTHSYTFLIVMSNFLASVIVCTISGEGLR